MTAQLRSELLKLRTTRTAGILLLGAAALAAFGVGVEGLSRGIAELGGEPVQREMFSAGTTGVFFATLAGLLIVTAEFRYGTIRPTLMVEPRRRHLLSAQAAAGALTGLVFGVVCVAVTFAAGLVLLTLRDVDPTLTADHALALTLGTVVASAFSAVIGVAVGSLVRSQAAAIVVVAAYAFVVDAALFASEPSIGRYLPGKAGDALAGRPDDMLLDPGVGALLFAAWAAAFLVAALVRMDRTDV